MIKGVLEGTGDFTQTTGTLQVNATGNNSSYTGDIKGGGAFTKLGDSTLTLSGANTFTGNITISAGALTIDSSGSLEGGTYDGAISNSGTFNYSSSATQNLDGVLSGTGALNVTDGLLRLRAVDHTYSGNTSISGDARLVVEGRLGTGGSYAGNF